MSMLWFHFYYNSTLMRFRSRCFDDEKQKNKNTFKDNCQSEHFIYQCYCLLLKFIRSVFKNLHAQHFIWCYIAHPNRIKRFSNYQGKTWYGSIVVPHYIFHNFFFVIITKMWTWMMSLVSIWAKRSIYLSHKGFGLNAFVLLINN